MNLEKIANDETLFKMNLIIKQYSNRMLIDEKILEEKMKEYYFENYKKTSDESLSLVNSIKELGIYCSKY
jgi:hypothetical protein